LLFGVAEFIRVPRNSDKPSATTRGICAAYDAHELGDVPLAAQLMGSNVQLLAAAAERLVHVKGAPRIDLNCGG
jgi:tRNA-dihydrouridine synthase C